MKKKLLSLLLVATLVFTLTPVALATDSSGLQDLIDGATAGSTINLSDDYTITDTVTITEGITIKGNGHTITYNGTGSAFSVTATAAVTLENVTIKAESSGAYAIALTSSQPDLTVKDSVITAHTRGISMYPVGGCTSGKLTVSNTDIKNSQISDYDHYATVGDTRGIALYDVKNSTITVDNGSKILGFGYTINLTGTLANGIRDLQGTTINVTGSTLMGWTAFNVWSANTVFNIKNSYLKGINNSDGYWDGFATIVVNDDIYNYGWGGADANVFNIYGGTITCYRTGDTSEQLFRVDNQGITKVNFNKYNRRTNVSIVDGTGDSEAVFYSGYEKTPDDWSTYMNAHVTGSENCTLTGYNGAALAFIPDGGEI